ncbi:hypothetical protein [Plasmodium yoelii yoelii]|uniref:Uncharacterized protein n=1 Tax=Plasmodium yoelii yoelii TaxID=73239 RepID=Q7RHF0_PLAYO|nr:hypothetical protein [Plasmodium yoelii yoelii]
MEDTIANMSEENLNYIKTCIGYSLAKSMLYAIKTDTEVLKIYMNLGIKMMALYSKNWETY